MTGPATFPGFAVLPVDREAAEAAVALFNGGLVRVPDGDNARGYTVRYLPKQAMAEVAASIRIASQRELVEALKPFAGQRLSTEPSFSDLVLRSPAEVLRIQAGETELRDAQILTARGLIASVEAPNG